jgi:hypothetical protein
MAFMAIPQLIYLESLKQQANKPQSQDLVTFVILHTAVDYQPEY